MAEDIDIRFIGIGAQKSATSWISKCLSEHPEICVCSQKEIHFFNNDAKFLKGIQYYKTFFKDCARNKISGEYKQNFHMLGLNNKNLDNLSSLLKNIITHIESLK